uniref:Uncharacterized protein n=1 Tax=viral metagenome TaxID=1070528 RepID=A0A6M3LIF1_9ZZZZ
MENVERYKGQFLQGKPKEPKRPKKNEMIYFMESVHDRISGTGKIPPRKGAL